MLLLYSRCFFHSVFSANLMADDVFVVCPYFCVFLQQTLKYVRILIFYLELAPLKRFQGPSEDAKIEQFSTYGFVITGHFYSYALTNAKFIFLSQSDGHLDFLQFLITLLTQKVFIVMALVLIGLAQSLKSCIWIFTHTNDFNDLIYWFKYVVS